MYCASYSFKTEAPDQTLLINIMARTLANVEDNTEQDFYRATANAVLERIELSLNAEQRSAYDCYTAGMSNDKDQFLLMIGGEGGTGKSLLIRAMFLWAKIHFGKTKSIFGPTLTMTPTGSSLGNQLLTKANPTKKAKKSPVQDC